MKSKTRLFVGSLPYRYSESEILKLFVTCGKVVDVRVIKNPWGRSRGIGYVQFENEEDALRAKEKYHNFIILDRTIIVDFAKEDPLDTPEGKMRQLEKIEAKKKKHFVPHTEKSNHIRETVYTQRKFGSKVGKKFASRNKK